MAADDAKGLTGMTGSSDAGFHLFFSYSRQDDAFPVNAAGEGWVTTFERDLRQRHRRYSGRDLRICFDKKSIGVSSKKLRHATRRARLSSQKLPDRVIW